MKMSKNSLTVLAKAIANKRGLSQEEAERFISKMFEVANAGLQEDKQLKMRWLGTFKVTAVKDRESIDVNTGERILIEGRDKITFTPDSILKEIVNKPFAQFETVVVNDGVDFSDIDEKFAHQPETEVLAVDSEGVDDANVLPKPVVDDTAKEVAVKEEKPVKEEEVSKDVAANEEVSKNTMVIEETSKNVVTDAVVSEEKASADITPKKVPETSADSDSEEVQPNAEEPNEEEVMDLALSQVSTSGKNVEDEPISAAKPVESSVQSEETQSPEASSSAAINIPVVEENECDNRHFMIPKYAVAIACITFVVLLGGIGWLAFSYGKMQAQRDHLAVQLQNQNVKSSVTSKSKPSVSIEDSAALALKKKAAEDSVRMAASSKAVEMAERTEEANEQQTSLAASQKKNTVDSNLKLGQREQKDNEVDGASVKQEQNANHSSRYDADPRVRTGAYRIVGIAQTVTVKSGQTLASISKLYLGSGMECYLEAVNGSSDVKAGQKVKIPKLELKRRSR